MSDALHLVCTACGGINRVPRDRLSDRGKCGRCGAVLVGDQPVSVDEAGLERLIRKDQRAILVDFWADWCGPCRMMAPAFAQASAQLAPTVLSVKVNTEQAQGVSARLGIRSIPTLVLFGQGREIARQAGAADAATIVQWVRSQLPNTAAA